MQSHFMNYKGDMVEAPKILGQIIINAYDGELVLWKDKSGEYHTRYGLDSAKHGTSEQAAVQQFNACMQHRLECEVVEL
ncbi:MAG: hypothetical protein R8K20_09260 [Gallionellaceae bacterium]